MAANVKVVKEKNHGRTEYAVKINGIEYAWGCTSAAEALKETLGYVLQERDKARKVADSSSKFKTALIEFLGKG